MSVEQVANHPPGLPPVLPPSGGKLSMEETVFGVGFQRDSKGNPIERGHGAKGHETPQHLSALERTKKFLEAEKGGDLSAVRALLREFAAPPEDMSPEDKEKIAAKEAQEAAQEKRIGSLEGEIASMAMKLDAVLTALGQKETPPATIVIPEVGERKVSLEDKAEF